jgi:LPXTG-motif cell wall-anchored protein
MEAHHIPQFVSQPFYVQYAPELILGAVVVLLVAALVVFLKKKK